MVEETWLCLLLGNTWCVAIWSGQTGGVCTWKFTYFVHVETTFSACGYLLTLCGDY